MLPLTGSFWKRRRNSNLGPPEALFSSWHSNPSIGADDVSIPPRRRNQRRNAVSTATQQPIQLQQHGDEHHADEARMSVPNLAVGELGVGLPRGKRNHTQLQLWPPPPSQQESIQLKVPAAAPHGQRVRTSSKAAEENQQRYSAMPSASRSPSRKPSAAVSRPSVKYKEPEREEATADSRRNPNTHVIVVDVTPASAPSAQPEGTPTAVSRRGSLAPSVSHLRATEATVSTGCQTEHPNAVVPEYRTVLVKNSGCQTVLDGFNLPYVELSEILRSQGGGSTLETHVNPAADVYSIPCAEDLPRCAYSFPSYPLVERLHTPEFHTKIAKSSEVRL